MEKQTPLTLVKKSKSYKMIIPAEVEKKIRHLCEKINNTEWSGVLFYEPSGKFEDDSLVITCKDIFPMDIGNATYTEFDMNPDVITYMTENPELLGYQSGLAHSHQAFSAFFSGTDQATLLEEGKDRNHFVSLIVNNAGTYTAAITRKVKYSEVKEIEYATFGGEIITSKENMVDQEEIEWFNLDIEKEPCNSEFSFIDARLDEIKKAKEAKKSVSSTTNIYTLPSIGANKSDGDIYDWKKYYKSYKKDEIPWEYPSDDPTLFDDLPEFKSTNVVKEVNTHSDKIENLITEEVIDNATIQLLTGSILTTKDNKLNLDRWVESMELLFDRRFGSDDPCLHLFEDWAMGFIEHILWNSVDFGTLEESECLNYFIEKLVEKLSEFKSNKYIEKYIEIIMSYAE